MRGLLLPLALLLAALLSGCQSPDAGPGGAGGAKGDTGGADEADDRREAPDATATKGIIRGLVIDDAIRPVARAEARLAPGDILEASDDAGTFYFGPLEPGFYTVTVSKAGFHSLEQGVTVLAGVDEPPVTKFQLNADPGTAAFFEQVQWTGFIQCGIGTPVPGYTPMACNIATGAYNEHVHVLPQVPTFVQTELTWKSTQALNNELRIIHRGTGGEYAGIEGTNPVILRVAGDVLAERLPEDLALIADVFPTNSDPDLIVNQGFEVYTTVFYNFLPPDEWTFINDGPPTVPT